MRSIRVSAKNMGDPYYEPTIVVHDIDWRENTRTPLFTLAKSKGVYTNKYSTQLCMPPT